MDTIQLVNINLNLIDNTLQLKHLISIIEMLHVGSQLKGYINLQVIDFPNLYIAVKTITFVPE
jgi:hypothetical protein